MKIQKKRSSKVLAAMLCAVMMLGTSMTVSANADPPENGEDTVLEESETGGTAFSTPGNAQVQDDITEDSSKEFFTITTKNNNTFYLVIDRSASTENVYMLSQIDENDLQEFLQDESSSVVETEKPPIVLEEETSEKLNEEPEQETNTEPEEEQVNDEQSNMTGILLILVLAAAGAAGYYYFKIYKRKAREEGDDEEGIELDDGLETIDEREETSEK